MMGDGNYFLGVFLVGLGEYLWGLFWVLEEMSRRESFCIIRFLDFKRRLSEL